VTGISHALTLWRPWPHAILFGGKRIENRPWKPWASIIGKRIAVHAGLRYDDAGAAWMRAQELYDPPEGPWCPAGVIVGTARVTGFVEASDDPWFVGPFGWLLADVEAFDMPVACRGAQGLWRVPAGLLGPQRGADQRELPL